MFLSYILIAFLFGVVTWLDPKLMFALDGGGYLPPEDNEKPRTQCDKGSKIPDPPKEKKDDFQLPPPPKAAPLPPPPRPPPPPTMTMPAVEEAMSDAKRKASRQNGMSKTLIAGETGGYNPTAAATNDPKAKKSLLG